MSDEFGKIYNFNSQRFVYYNRNQSQLKSTLMIHALCSMLVSEICTFLPFLATGILNYFSLLVPLTGAIFLLIWWFLHRVLGVHVSYMLAYSPIYHHRPRINILKTAHNGWYLADHTQKKIFSIWIEIAPQFLSMIPSNQLVLVHADACMRYMVSMSWWSGTDDNPGHPLPHICVTNPIYVTGDLIHSSIHSYGWQAVICLSTRSIAIIAPLLQADAI